MYYYPHTIYQVPQDMPKQSHIFDLHSLSRLEYQNFHHPNNDFHIDEFANLPMYQELYSVERIFVYNYPQNYQNYQHQEFQHCHNFQDKLLHIFSSLYNYQHKKLNYI